MEINNKEYDKYQRAKKQVEEIKGFSSSIRLKLNYFDDTLTSFPIS